MPIPVICPNCKAQFRVSEKFAGKQGPCPKCKTVIKVPEIEEIKIHAPDDVATQPKSGAAAAEAALRPVARKKFELSPVLIALILMSLIGSLLFAWVAGDMLRVSPAIAAVGLALISIPLAAGAYEILRDDELEPFQGAELWIRTGICGLLYAALWCGFYYVPPGMFANNWNWLFIPVPFLLIGWATAYLSLDLGSDNSFFHYAFYLLLTLLLRALVGLPALWNLAPATPRVV